MNCPSCNKKPVGIFHSFRFNGVNLKEMINGYFRCRYCGTLLRQSKGSGMLPKFQKGYWWRAILTWLIMCAGIFGMLFLNVTGEFNSVFLIGIFMVWAIVFLIILDEIKVRYWIIQEADKQEDKLNSPRMGALGWILEIAFLVVMIGGLIAFDQYFETSSFSQWKQWQQIGGMLLYVMVIIGGAIGIFNYFSETMQETADT